MKSFDLGKRGFGTWRAFTIRAEGELLRQFPTSPGVYSMRFTRADSRLRGESDIAYIGKGTNQNGLQGRIRQYFHPGWQQSTNLAMKARLLEGVALELAYVVTHDAGEAVDLESELLLAFEAEHGERPPFNKQAALAHLWGKLTES
jgi:excinuclease UvrABC nuclease subunit